MLAIPCITRKCSGSLALIIGLFIGTNVTPAQEILYVDAHATGPIHDGSTWCDAFTDLQDALGVAVYGDEIRVADGIYTPDRGSGDRTATFQLLNGVALRGGFAGCGADDPDERNVGLYSTRLSGDLDSNDDLRYFPNGSSFRDNSYHVVEGFNLGAATVLDGFMICGGNANKEEPLGGFGGGMLNWRANITITQCIFVLNWACEGGGGLANILSNPILIECVFSHNASQSGGGMYNGPLCESVLQACVFIENTVVLNGAGIYSTGANLMLTNCMFFNNSTDTWGYGGGICTHAASHNSAIANCIFLRNSAGTGGGMYDSTGDLTLTNCTFGGNLASAYGPGSGGGGIYIVWGNNLMIANNIFWGNSDYYGMGESAQIAGGPTLFLEYCCVQGWTGSMGGIWNNGNDPLFVNEDYNLRLCPSSSCIDSGNNEAVPAYVILDADDNPRFLDDPDTVDTGNGTPPIVDRGAYEYHYDPDFDGDGIPDDCDPDVDGDGIPNDADVCEFSELGEPVNSAGGPMGDFDDDCALTLDDYFYFEVCLSLSGPGGDPGFPSCVDRFDFDANPDHDVDLMDFAAFQLAFTGP